MPRETASHTLSPTCTLKRHQEHTLANSFFVGLVLFVFAKQATLSSQGLAWLVEVGRWDRMGTDTASAFHMRPCVTILEAEVELPGTNKHSTACVSQ